MPAFKKLLVIVMPEEATRVAALKTGALDVTEIGLENSIELEKSGFRTVAIDVTTPSPQLHGAYDPRATGMPITDIRVRQALSLAINRDEIAESFFYGKAGPPMPPYLVETSPDIDVPYWLDYCAKLYRYNTDEAIKLLKEAGYPNGFNFKFYTTSPSGAAYLPRLAEVVQSYWAKIGVKAELVPIDASVYLTWRNPGARGPADPLVGQGIMYRYSPGGHTVSNLGALFHSTGMTGLVGKAMPELDQLIDEATSEMDVEKRRELLAKAIKAAVDSFTIFQIGSAPSMSALGPKVNIDFPSPMPAAYLPMFAVLAQHR